MTESLDCGPCWVKRKRPSAGSQPHTLLRSRAFAQKRLHVVLRHRAYLRALAALERHRWHNASMQFLQPARVRVRGCRRLRQRLGMRLCHRDVTLRNPQHPRRRPCFCLRCPRRRLPVHQCHNQFVQRKLWQHSRRFRRSWSPSTDWPPPFPADPLGAAMDALMGTPREVGLVVVRMTGKRCVPLSVYPCAVRMC